MRINKILFMVTIIISTIITFMTISIKPHEINDINNSSHNYNNDYRNNTLNKSYLKISNVNLNSSSSYNICTGSISVNSSSPYKYHFIKVKASFLDNYGKTIDTDWTYAIGNEWLEPGESNKFQLSVTKDYNISKCVVTIMEN